MLNRKRRDQAYAKDISCFSFSPNHSSTIFNSLTSISSLPHSFTLIRYISESFTTDAVSTTSQSDTTYFMYEMTSNLAQSEEPSWVLPLVVTEAITTEVNINGRALSSFSSQSYIMLPSTNCSLINGDELTSVLTSNNISGGEYCLISIQGWSYLLRPIQNCPDNATSEDLVFTLSQVVVTTPPRISGGDDLDIILISCISCVLILGISIAALFFYRKYKSEKKMKDNLRVDLHRVKKQLKENGKDIKMLVRVC